MELPTIVVISLVTLGFGSYIFLMIYFPEWVGITGKSAKQTDKDHIEGSEVDDGDFLE